MLWCTLLGLPACILGAILASLLDVTLLRRLFGVFLLFIGFRELFSGTKKKKHGRNVQCAMRNEKLAGQKIMGH